MELDDPTLLDFYADMVLGHLYPGKRGQSANAKQGKIRSALCLVASVADLPMPNVIWTTDDNSFFRHAPWEIHASHCAASSDPDVDFKDWLHKVTSPYHELRHADQHRMMILGYLSGGIAIPNRTRHSRGVLPHREEVVDRMDDLHQDFYDNLKLLMQLEKIKHTFEQGWIPQIRQWSDSLFGGASGHRNQVFTVLHKLGPAGELKDHHHAAYRNLPEEADAFRVQKLLKHRIKERVGKIKSNSGIAERVS